MVYLASRAVLTAAESSWSVSLLSRRLTSVTPSSVTSWNHRREFNSLRLGGLRGMRTCRFRHLVAEFGNMGYTITNRTGVSFVASENAAKQIIVPTRPVHFNDVMGKAL